VSTTSRSAPRPAFAERALRVGLAVFGVSYLLIALFQVADPVAFVHDIGPYGAPNGHYVRDLSTFSAALGAGLLIAAWTPSWRVPMLVVAVVQGVLHTVNHLVDIDAATRSGAGVANAVALALSVAVLVWLLSLARRESVA
jgi:hypothetical protein